MKRETYDRESLASLCSFDLMMALRSTENRNVTPKNLTPFRPENCEILNHILWLRQM